MQGIFLHRIPCFQHIGLWKSSAPRNWMKAARRKHIEQKEKYNSSNRQMFIQQCSSSRVKLIFFWAPREPAQCWRHTSRVGVWNIYVSTRNHIRKVQQGRDGKRSNPYLFNPDTFASPEYDPSVTVKRKYVKRKTVMSPISLQHYLAQMERICKIVAIFMHVTFSTARKGYLLHYLPPICFLRLSLVSH